MILSLIYKKNKNKKKFVATVLISLLCYRIQVGGGDKTKKKIKMSAKVTKNKQTNNSYGLT